MSREKANVSLYFLLFKEKKFIGIHWYDPCVERKKRLKFTTSQCLFNIGDDEIRILNSFLLIKMVAIYLKLYTLQGISCGVFFSSRRRRGNYFLLKANIYFSIANLRA